MPENNSVESSCKRWRLEELLPLADLISCQLMLHNDIAGVALTGSLARLEPLIHDIDMVVFHDGNIEDGSCEGSEEKRRSVGYNGTEIYLALERFIGESLSKKIASILGEVPSHLIFVNERILWNCEYLLERDWAVSGALGLNTGLYKTVFCQIPLLLLNPHGARSKLHEISQKVKTERFDKNVSWTRLPYAVIRHACANPACKPEEPWEERQKKIKRKKGHTWHD